MATSSKAVVKTAVVVFGLRRMPELSQIEVTQAVNMVDVGTLDDQVDQSKPGTRKLEIRADGVVSSRATADYLAEVRASGVADRPFVSTLGAGGTGSSAVLGRGVLGSASQAAERGAALKVSISGALNALALGDVLRQSYGPEADPVVVATGVGDPVQLGPLADGQTLAVVVAVPGPSGISGADTTFLPRLESDTAAGNFSGLEVSRWVAAEPIEEHSAIYIEVPGPVTDEWWRLAWDVTGTDPKVAPVAAAGLLEE